MPVLCGWLLFCPSSQAQTLRALEKAGDEAVEQKDFYAALVHFSEALSMEPSNTRLCYKYAEVARHFNAYQIAAEYYEKVMKSPESMQYTQAIFWLAMMKKSLGWYQEAETYFARFLTSKPFSPDESYMAGRAKQELAWCREVLKSGATPDHYIQVEQMGKQINSEYSDFAPFERGDTLYYTSYRFDNKEDSHQPARKISKVLISVNGARGRALSRGLNEEEKSTAHTAFSLDGRRMYFTICDYVSDAGLHCGIYYRELDKFGKWSRKAAMLPTFINQDGYTATHPSIGFDSIALQEILFFASDRPGGKGGLDIWFSLVQEDGFSKPRPVEALNTPEHDVTPYFDNASQTLFFSSEGYAGWGELDVFSSRLDSGRWAAPVLLPAPVNSGYDDLYYTPGKNPDQAWLASNRPGSFYLDPANKACCNDLFKITYLPKPPPQDTLPHLLEETPPPPPVTVLPERPQEPQKLEDFLPLALYFDNDEPDKRTNRISTRKTYGETFSRYFQRKEEYLREYGKPLTEEAVYEAEEAMEAFFEEEVRKGHDHLERFSEILLGRLQNGDRVEIFIKGYTSPRARSDYNLALGQRRISSVRNHFQAYRDGIFRSYLSSGALRITERSFGEELASRDVSDELADLRNSVYSIGAARERRVEIVEIQSNR